MRKSLFDDTILATIVADEILQSDLSKHTKTFAYVVMPDHLHWLFQLKADFSLSAVMQRVKGRSAFRINKSRNNVSTIWQAGYHDRALRAEESLEVAGDYVITNPVRAGLVSRIEDYPMWDLMWERIQSENGGKPGLTENKESRLKPLLRNPSYADL